MEWGKKDWEEVMMDGRDLDGERKSLMDIYGFLEWEEIYWGF